MQPLSSPSQDLSTPTPQLFDLLRLQHTQGQLDKAHSIALIISQRLDPLTQQQYAFIQKVQGEYEAMIKAARLLDKDSSDWHTMKIGNKQYEGTIASKVYGRSGVEAQIKGQFEVNGANLVSMVYEEDLYTEWVPFCCESKIIKEVSPKHKLVFVKFGFPYISTREIVFQGQAFDRFEHNGTLLLHMRGVTDDQKLEKEHDVKLSPAEKKGSPFECENIVVEMNVADPVYKFRTYSNVDLKVLYLPQFVVSFFSGRIGNFVFDKVVTRAASLKDTEWEKRIEKDQKGIYARMDEKLKTWGAKTLKGND